MDFEREYEETLKQQAPPPTAVIPPYRGLSQGNTILNLNGKTVFHKMETLNDMDLGDMDFNLFRDPNINITSDNGTIDSGLQS